MKSAAILCALSLVVVASSQTPTPPAPAVPGAGRIRPNLADNIARPLRYRPHGEDFVITNGAEFFNRPLYGRPTAFRVDAGDKPEFVLYLPGRGGNLRFGLRRGGVARWLHDAERIEARYRPGTMLYEIADPLLGNGGILRLEAIAMHETDGLMVRIEATDVAPGVELVWAYGGVNGERGVRDGDIGTERVPISEWFQLRPEFCRDNAFRVDGAGFTLASRTATIRGLMPPDAQLAIADARHWGDCAALLDSGGAAAEMSVVVGRLPLLASGEAFLALQRIEANASAEELATYRDVTANNAGAARVAPAIPLRAAYRAEDLPAAFAAARGHFAALRHQVEVLTPDPFLNAAVGALNVAADAVWDEPQGVVMHGAIAWRSRLLGWRGPYAMDALGWHDRARRHFSYWATRQNTEPIPGKLPPPDANANLARSEAALHSNGDMSNSHYDMNLVYIDALFRHLLWTGDKELASSLWPVIERHLAWERRLFRREFGAEKLPLYEAYAAIWASDDLQYHGGGTTHASAYNYWHNRMAARIARWLGRDPAPYAREAELIAGGMRQHLWTGTHFAEFKDLLGQRLVHPNAALWTFYHAMDAGLPTTGEAASMSDYLRDNLPFLPVKGEGVPADDKYGVYASTNWLPYSWSINNVVMGENIHTALGLWQAGRPEEAFRLTKSALLASMYMGICPGNVGSMNYLDVYRRESQRDFADGNGVTSRALIEGLFGVRPDLIEGEVIIAPGFPDAWEHALMRHPRVAYEFRREGSTDRFRISPNFGSPVHVKLMLPRRGETAVVTANGRRIFVPELVDDRILPIPLGPAPMHEVEVKWLGAKPARESSALAEVKHSTGTITSVQPVTEAQEALDLSAAFNERVTAIFQPGKYVSPRSPYVSLAIPSQGIGAWAGHVNARADIDDSGLRAAATAGGGRITLPNGVVFATPSEGEAANIVFTSQWDNYPREATVPLSGRAKQVHLLMAGSTNHMQSRIDNGEVVVTYADGSTSRLALRNPETWWPIEQDYFVDDFQFRVDAPLPTRVDLRIGRARVLDAADFKGRGRTVPGGAATVLLLPLDPQKELHSLTVRALANEVVIGLMAVTLAR